MEESWIQHLIHEERQKYIGEFVDSHGLNALVHSVSNVLITLIQQGDLDSFCFRQGQYINGYTDLEVKVAATEALDGGAEIQVEVMPITALGKDWYKEQFRREYEPL